MQTDVRTQASTPRNARGLILFWLLSLPIALAAMVYALGLI